ncbi:MAG: hypothetical protein IH589_07035 [Anaerolineales bacterium]|nr:hypothetical protein [Anaerolineales bacterium]
MSKTLETQNKIIISLLARSALGIKEIERIVRSGKKKENQDKFVLVYNALDGSKSGTELAKIVGITKQGMSQVFQTWEEEGIVYKNDETGFYVGLLKLPIKRKSPTKTKVVSLNNEIDTTIQEEEENGKENKN